jgi:oligoribonuclease
VRKSNITCAQAAEATFDFIRDYCERETAVLAGNSVWVDRGFLRRYMPQITDYLHYRIIDVSTVKELVRRWYPKNPQIDFKKPNNHRALEDIYGSIDELQHFREYFFVEPNE